DLLPRHRIFLSVGHDEYWSWAMREHVEAARDQGVHLAFLGANACFWQIRFEPGASGAPDRTVVAYKDAVATDPVAADPSEERARRASGRWRDAPTARPESALIGVMYLADPVDGDVVVDDADHWAFAGTGLRRGSVLPGLLGYEVDAVAEGSPAGLRRLAHSPFSRPSGETGYADMTIHETAGGALVFATGSMYWNWGLDGYNAPRGHGDRVSAAAQRITRNVLERMLAGGPRK
ncbi:MAG TPA: N,N-dimethylformamidase beta subunit family domain-containing protein, partial [Methylomirabilota bacterium]|nr:N,N-dimethylformamidase beta subunit family domain-containing protein [Methylomirabilota bacterium]